MNTRNFVFSASSFKEYLNCGLQFKYHRIDKLTPTSVASHHRWFGSLVHSLIYTGIAQYNSDKDYTLRETPDYELANSLLDEVWEPKEDSSELALHLAKDLGKKPTGHFMAGKIVSLGSNNKDINQEQLEHGWKAEASKMIRNGISLASEIPEILELEKKLSWEFADRKFIGYADIVGKDKDGKIEFYDFKTSWSKPFYLDNDFQFFSYSVALKDLFGLDYFPEGHFVHLRSGTLFTTIVTPKIYGKTLNKVKIAFSNLEHDMFFDSYGSPLCRFCDFRHICYGNEENIWQ